MDWMWMILLQQQAEAAARARQQAEAEAKAKADADAKAAADAEAKRQAQIAAQRQTDAAASQQAEADRKAAASKLPGPSDPYGEYRASINLDNSGTQNTARMLGSSSPTPMAAPSNPMAGFASAPSGLAGMFSNAVKPRGMQPSADFGQSKSSGNVVGGNQSSAGGSGRYSMF